jgi:hypothetical protein
MGPDAAQNPDATNDPAKEQATPVDPPQTPVIDEFFEEAEIPAEDEAADTEEDEAPGPPPHLPGGYVRAIQEEFEEQEEEGKIHPEED